ncbi:MAG: sugar kinase [Deltaproteobacteria bacterium]|nr:sugar kinase [Deltaproteobacteria bacterium]
MSLLCVGSVAYDVIELPGRDPVAVLGGSATWFTTAASLLTRPSLVAVVGEDFLEEDRAFLEQRGVDLAGLERRPGKTFRWHGRYHADMKGRDSLATELGVFAEFSPVIPPALRAPDVLFLGNIKPDLQGLVLAQCRSARFVGLDTIQIWIDNQRDDLVRLMPRVDLLFLNDDEVVRLSGDANVITAARRVLGMGAKALVVKRGEHGALLFTPERISLFPAFPIEAVVDPTGAGDSFAAGTVGYLDLVRDVSPASIRDALAVGTVVASFCVEGFGPRSFDRVTQSALAGRLKRYFEMVRTDERSVLAAVEV